MVERLVWVLENIQGLSPLQFRFHQLRSTADPLLRLEYDISAAFENGKFVLAVFFDLQKSYDTTWKRGVLRKLLSLGFCRHLPLFIRNLLAIAPFVFELGIPSPHLLTRYPRVPSSVFCFALAIMILLLLYRR